MIITLGHTSDCQLVEWVEIDMQEKANGSCPTRGIKIQTSGVLSAVTSYPYMETFNDILCNRICRHQENRIFYYVV